LNDARHRPEFDDEAESAFHCAARARTNGGESCAPVTRQAVGRQLKCLFAELTSGPMPDHLLALVDQLEAAEADDEGLTPAGRRS